jgi:Tol biopolymer transport system component
MMVGTCGSKRWRAGMAVAVVALLVASGVALAPTARAAPGTMKILTLGVGSQFANGATKEPSVSASGRLVAFASSASNLVAGDSNGKDDIFVRDQATGTVLLVSRATNGELGNGNSAQPSISPDGRYVAFVSESTNFQQERNPIVNGVEKNARDIFLRDLHLGTTIRVTLGGGNPGKVGSSFDPSVSTNADYIAFTSLDKALIGVGDCNDVHDVFMWERATGKYTLIAKGTTTTTCGTPAAPYQGQQMGDRESQNPTVSADGRYVVFSSDASNLDPTKPDSTHYNLPAPPLSTDPDLGTNIFLWDRVTGTIKRIDNGPGGAEPNDDAGFVPTISGDGSKIAYMSDATNLVSGDTNALRDTFLYDVASGTTTRVSVASDGTQQTCPQLQDQTACQSYEAPALSFNGRYVAFISGATNLIVNGFDSNVTGRDVYIRDNNDGTIVRASVDDNGTQGDAGTIGSAPSLSADGRFVTFPSNAKNLVPGDANSTPQVADLFVYDATPGVSDPSWSGPAPWESPGGCTGATGCGNNPGPGDDPASGGSGYWMVASDGGIFAFGNAKFQGSTGNIKLAQPIVGMTATPSGQGYWLVARDGGIFAFGDAQFKGSTGNIKLAQPIVGMTTTPTGQGYWLVASDGGVFAFGDAKFQGSTGNIKLAKPIVGMTTTPTGGGYWMVASDGGIFAFGDAKFKGSTGDIKLAQPIVAMTAMPTGDGYWMVASDGGIFAFGDAEFKGSTGNVKLAQPIVTMTATQTGSGYWLVARDGGVFAFGDGGFKGSTGDIKLNSPIVGMTGF